MSWLCMHAHPGTTWWGHAVQVSQETQNEHAQDRKTMGQGKRENRLGCSRRRSVMEKSGLIWRHGDARCAQAIHDHLYAYGRTRGAFFSPCTLGGRGKGPAEPSGLDLSCHDFCGCSKDSSPCEHDQLLLGSLERVGSASRVGVLFIRWIQQKERATRDQEIRQEAISETGQATSLP